MKSFRLNPPVVCILAALCVTGALLEANGQGPSKPQLRINSSIVELMQKRHAVLSQLVKVQTKAYHQGEESIDAIIHAHQELVKVKLELAATDDDRNTLLEQAARLARDLERTAGAKYKSGQASRADVLKSQTERLKAEVDLLRLRQRFEKD